MSETKFVVRAYGSDHEFDSRDAAEMFFESNACACDKVDGEYVRQA